MKIETQVQTRTHKVAVATSEADGYMYLTFQGGGGGYEFKLTEENREALRKVLGPTPNWKGIL